MKFISEIQGTFIVKKRGVVVMVDLKDSPILIIDDPLILSKKNGDQKNTILKGIEFFRGGVPGNSFGGLLLDTNINNEDIEIGDRIFLNKP